MVDISPITQAILMLVSPLLAGGRTQAGLLLTPKEYTRLVQALRRLDSQPGDLLGSEASGLLDALAVDFDRERLGRLLARGMQASLALEQWQRLSISGHQPCRSPVSPAPQEVTGVSVALPALPLRQRVPSEQGGPGGGGFPQGGPGSACVHPGFGERWPRPPDARLSPVEPRVSTQAGMQGAGAAGGQVVGVLAHDLARAVMQRDYRNALMNQELLLCSPFDPTAGFKAWQAMERNKLIYALADAALVVQSDVGKGGTWSGAKEQIPETPLRAGVYADGGDRILPVWRHSAISVPAAGPNPVTWMRSGRSWPPLRSETIQTNVRSMYPNPAMAWSKGRSGKLTPILKVPLGLTSYGTTWKICCCVCWRMNLCQFGP